MKKVTFLFLFFWGAFISLSFANNLPYQSVDSVQHDAGETLQEGEEQYSFESEEGHNEAPLWTVIPFVALLLMIATGPLFYENFWHKNYPSIAVALAVIVVFYFIFVLQNVHGPIHALAEYIPFISLLAALYIASGGIGINIDKKSTPLANVGLLLAGAVVANLIGTTGASMLLIRPYVRLNKNRIQPYHIIFFIFVISNVGGALTPIGDPPLFLGFLKGIPFFWTLIHNFLPWLFTILALCGIFYLFDRRNKEETGMVEEDYIYTNKISIIGARNFFWLLIIVIFVFIDPNVFAWVPSIRYDGQNISFIKEIVWLSVCFLSYKYADKKALETNEFSFGPIREVAFIFIGIFGTMMPALELVGNFAQSEAGAPLITHNTLYWGTGFLSGFLDNAPTYLNFLAAAMASQDASIASVSDVRNFAIGGIYDDSVLSLKAVSIAAVFFGAMTYIGNGPNFMVKSIAEQIGIKMPSFFGYIVRFSIPILLPLLILVWLIFFAFK